VKRQKRPPGQAKGAAQEIHEIEGPGGKEGLTAFLCGSENPEDDGDKRDGEASQMQIAGKGPDKKKAPDAIEHEVPNAISIREIIEHSNGTGHVARICRDDEEDKEQEEGKGGKLGFHGVWIRISNTRDESAA
jgi:hypothetical protein